MAVFLVLGEKTANKITYAYFLLTVPQASTNINSCTLCRCLWVLKRWLVVAFCSDSRSNKYNNPHMWPFKAFIVKMWVHLNVAQYIDLSLNTFKTCDASKSFVHSAHKKSAIYNCHLACLTMWAWLALHHFCCDFTACICGRLVCAPACRVTIRHFLLFYFYFIRPPKEWPLNDGFKTNGYNLWCESVNDDSERTRPAEPGKWNWFLNG